MRTFSLTRPVRRLPAQAGLLYPAWPHACPTGMGQDRATNLPTGTPLRIRYVDDPVSSWVDMDATPDSLGRTMNNGSDPVLNLAIFQRWVNDDVASSTRRGYECAPASGGNTVKLRGLLTTGYNAGAGWSALRPTGETYDADTEVPLRKTDAGIVWEATGANQPAFRTNTGTTNSQDHGRWALIGGATAGIHITHDSTTGGTFTAAISEGLVRIGSSSQTSMARVATGILLHRVNVRGQPGKYLGRDVYCDGQDVEIRASIFEECHRSNWNPADPDPNATAQIQDAQCLLIEKSPGYIDVRYSILHGGDECVNLGGGPALISGLEMGHMFFGGCEFSHDDAFLFDTAAGPADKVRVWQAKNCAEQKTGSFVLEYACRYTGLMRYNNNQGYLKTCKVGAYGTLAPNQTSRHVMCIASWFDRGPGMIGLSGYESTNVPRSPALNAKYFAAIDCFGWDLNYDYGDGRNYTQGGKRTFFAQNITHDQDAQTLADHGTVDFEAAYFRHCTIATRSTSGDGVAFGYNMTLPNGALEDCLLTWQGSAFFANNGISTTTLGNNAIAAVGQSGAPFSAERNSVMKSSALSNYPASWNHYTSFAAMGIVDQAAGNLRLSPSAPGYRGNADAAPDGGNRGVFNPDQVYAQLARTPTYLASHPTVP